MGLDQLKDNTLKNNLENNKQIFYEEIEIRKNIEKLQKKQNKIPRTN